MLDADFFTNISAPRKPTLRVVADEDCPSCRLPGSPKVCDRQGRWHWKCLSSYDDCKVAYWLPGYGSRYIEMKLPPAEAAAQAKRIHDEITEQMKDRIWISRGNTSTTIHKDEAIPEGWHRTGTEASD